MFLRHLGLVKWSLRGGRGARSQYFLHEGGTMQGRRGRSAGCPWSHGRWRLDWQITPTRLARKRRCRRQCNHRSRRDGGGGECGVGAGGRDARLHFLSLLGELLNHFHTTQKYCWAEISGHPSKVLGKSIGYSFLPKLARWVGGGNLLV